MTARAGSACAVRSHVRFTERLAVATEAARAAGQDILGLWHADELDVRTKTSVTDLVCAADLHAQRICVSALHDAFPDDGIITEEGVSIPSANEFVWAVDPLDGTSNFVHGIGHWCTVISGWYQDRPVLGVVYDAVRGELFACATDSPLSCNGDPVRQRRRRDLDTSAWATGFTAPDGRSRRHSFASEVLARVGHVRQMGSLGLDLAWTACGRFDAFLYECDLDPWVHGAGAVMCEQAGMRMVELPASARYAAALAVVPADWNDLLGS